MRTVSEIWSIVKIDQQELKISYKQKITWHIEFAGNLKTEEEYPQQRCASRFVFVIVLNLFILLLQIISSGVDIVSVSASDVDLNVDLDDLVTVDLGLIILTLVTLLMFTLMTFLVFTSLC